METREKTKVKVGADYKSSVWVLCAARDMFLDVRAEVSSDRMSSGNGIWQIFLIYSSYVFGDPFEWPIQP